jgi:hypothetical protein
VTDYDALLRHARDICSPDEWLNLSALERDLLASTAAAMYGTRALNHRDDPRLIRRVHADLLKPSVLLGVVCDCGEPLEDDGFCKFKCFAPQPRDHQSFAQKQGRR